MLSSSNQVTPFNPPPSIPKEKNDQTIGQILNDLLKKIETPIDYTPDLALSLCHELDDILLQLSDSSIKTDLLTPHHSRMIRENFNRFNLEKKELGYYLGHIIEILNDFPNDSLCIEQKAHYFFWLGFLEEKENYESDKEFCNLFNYYIKALSYAKEPERVHLLRERFAHLLFCILKWSSEKQQIEIPIPNLPPLIISEFSFVENIQSAYQNYQSEFKKDFSAFYQELSRADQLYSERVRNFQRLSFIRFQQFFYEEVLKGPLFLLNPEQMPPHDFHVMGSLGEESRPLILIWSVFY